ncbi:MAG: thiamine-monophosphate kinase [Candidatus Omnitrophica bacterium]|nr:thiamine-monophosphate kinase [Candidatus Omnitrophota bacterium]
MTSLSKLGEFGLIDRIKRSVFTDASVIKGIGDDCAVLKYDSKNYQLLTSDMVTEGVDFLFGEDPYFIGRKSLAVSLSDIASCCGVARYFMVSLGLPEKYPVSSVDKIFLGMRALADEFGLSLIGGDITKAARLLIDVTVLGSVKKNRLALRGGARLKDIIFVTGEIGGSLKGKHLKFTPRLREAGYLAKNFKINAMIDISDGLTQDLGHILQQSKKGARIYEDLIPLSPEASGLKKALHEGEDFELLFTLPQAEAKRLLGAKIRFFQPIGEIIPEKYGLRLVDKKGKETKIKPEGFLHFRAK